MKKYIRWPGTVPGTCQVLDNQLLSAFIHLPDLRSENNPGERTGMRTNACEGMLSSGRQEKWCCLIVGVMKHEVRGREGDAHI